MAVLDCLRKSMKQAVGEAYAEPDVCHVGKEDCLAAALDSIEMRRPRL